MQQNTALPVIQTEGLSKIYRLGEEEIRALDGVNLRVEQGEFVAVVGQSGSGKSTLMHLLGCLDRPTDGCYRLGGRDVSTLSQRELARIRNRQIGFVFQGFNLIAGLSALENVELPLSYRRMPAARRRELATECLCRVGLSHRLHHRPSEMSGGQQQRVAIARAVATQPDLILADEPTGNLDPQSGSEVMELLCQLNREGKTILLITHDSGIAAKAQRAVRMHNGRLQT